MKPRQKYQILIWLAVGFLFSIGIALSSFLNLSPGGLLRPSSTSAAAQSLSLTPGSVVTLSHSPMMNGSARPGADAPNFKIPLLNTGLETSLRQFQGQAVVLNFWASWCDQCKLETPLLEKAYQEEKEKGLVILGIDLGNEDARADALIFMAKFGVTYPLLRDNGDAVARSYFVYGIPTSVFISRTGKIQLSHIGSLDAAELQTSLSQILGR